MIIFGCKLHICFAMAYLTTGIPNPTHIVHTHTCTCIHQFKYTHTQSPTSYLVTIFRNKSVLEELNFLHHFNMILPSNTLKLAICICLTLYIELRTLNVLWTHTWKIMMVSIISLIQTKLSLRSQNDRIRNRIF